MSNETAPPNSNHPTVIIPGGNMTITESAEALFQAIAPAKELFYRGGTVVEVVQEGGDTVIRMLDAAAAQSRFEKYVQFKKRHRIKGGVETVATTINEAVAKQYLRAKCCRDLLPRLNGIVHCPLLMEKDGKLHQTQVGYDEVTGLYTTACLSPKVITLDFAVTLLSKLAKDFDFVTPGDLSRAVASLLTPALKLGGFIKGPVPVDVAEANASQAGKTYRQRLVAAVYNEHLAIVTKKGGGVGSMEETFSDHLVKGRGFIQFDNLRGKLDSQYVESFLTAQNTFSTRIPYHGNINIDPSKFFLFISSNGFEATPDLANRASIIRIRKRENHQYYSGGGKDILQLVYEWQADITGCVFAVIQEWFNRGKPKTSETRHDFREWCQTLDWIVQNIFKLAPLMDGHHQAKTRAANPHLTFVRAVAIKINEEGRLGQQVSASDIAELCLEGEIEIPGLRAEDKNPEKGRMQVGRILGKLLKDKVELDFDEFRLVKQEERALTDADNYQTVKKYTFSPSAPAGLETSENLPAAPQPHDSPKSQLKANKPNEADSTTTI